MTSDDILFHLWIHKQPSNAMVAELTIQDAEKWRRIDALWISGAQRTAFEIKVSRSDFLRETEEKRAPWKRVCHRFIYVCPAHLIQPREVPADCGLWWIHPYGTNRYQHVEVKKRATINREPEPLPQSIFVTLAHRASTRPIEPKDFRNGQAHVDPDPELVASLDLLEDSAA